MLAVGLVTYQAVFVIGIVLLLVSGAEWTAEAWAQRASADPRHNAEVRDRIANPLEFPLAAAIGIGVIVYSFSRVMLFLSKTNTVIVVRRAGLDHHRPGVLLRLPAAGPVQGCRGRDRRRWHSV